MALTTKTIEALKPLEKPYKRSDARGLYIEVHPNGSRYWRLKYRIHGHEKKLALGVWPDVSLAMARDGRDAARKQLAAGIDPSAVKRASKGASADTLKALSLEWLQKQTMAPATRQKADWMFEKLLFPHLGSRPIRTITAPDVLAVLRRIEARGKIETAHRCKQRVGQIMRYAIATGRADRDPTADLRGALAPLKTEHRPAITDPKKVGALLRALDGYPGQPAVHYALRLAPYLFVRPGELRGAAWDEFYLDSEQPEWRIPASRTKMRDQHIVPLARQVIELLRELQPISSGHLLFASLRTKQRPISEATLNAALRRLGYAGSEMTPHGFRTIASTLLNEQGFAADVIELQLAHQERDRVRGAYNRSLRLDERRRMMEAWADYLDGLRRGANVVVIGLAEKKSA
jgi:integrase